MALPERMWSLLDRRLSEHFTERVAKVKHKSHVFGPTIYDYLVPSSLQEQLEKLDQEYLLRAKSISMSVRLDDVTYDFVADFGKYRPLKSTDHYSTFQVPEDNMPGIYAALCVLANDLKLIEYDQVILKYELKRVFETCKTINQFLAVWPSARDYLADRYQERIRKIKKQGKPITELSDGAKAALVRMRFFDASKT